MLNKRFTNENAKKIPKGVGSFAIKVFSVVADDCSQVPRRRSLTWVSAKYYLNCPTFGMNLIIYVIVGCKFQCLKIHVFNSDIIGSL